MTGTSTFSGTLTVPTPVNGMDATTKSYIDGATYLTAGTGLSRAGATLSVNAAQTQITSVGTLTSFVDSGSIVQNVTAAPTGTTYVKNSMLAGNYGLSISGGSERWGMRKTRY